MSSRDQVTRTRILIAAMKLMARHDGKGVRMGDIAKAAGISRQAVYLHFSSRAELLEATTKHMDGDLKLEERLRPSRNAESGRVRLAAYIEFWGSYLPEIYSVARAILCVKDTDEAAASAWRERMAAHRDGCRAAIEALHHDGELTQEWSVDQAIDCLWTLLSVRNWEQLTQDCGWSEKAYVQRLKQIANRTFIKNS